MTPNRAAVQVSADPRVAADQLRTVALHGLSHDLREPIRTILCYSELLGRSEAIRNDPNLLEFVHLIAGAAQRMRALGEGMLQYSRLLGEETVAFCHVDMNAVVQTALANLHLLLEETNGSVAADDLPAVHGDQVQLTELVQNIVANALKYHGAEPPMVRIRGEQRGAEVIVSIQDNGPGIEPCYQASIFSPFKRLHGRDIPGAGLGLAICRQIIELHRGRIWVESNSGVGCIFYIALPAASSAKI